MEAIEGVLTHAQGFFYDESLQTRITLRVNGDIMYWPDNRMVANGKSLSQFRYLLLSNRGEIANADAHVLFTAHAILKALGVAPDDLPKGDAFVGFATFDTVCDPNYKGVSILERINANGSGQSMIRFFLHELGHNLGMSHDGVVEKYFGLPKGTCKKTKNKIMGRKDWENWTPRPYVWTACNRCNLLRSYHKKMIQTGEYCMDRS